MSNAITGVVTEIKVGEMNDNTCMLGIKDSITGDLENVLLWTDSANELEVPTFSSWIARSISVGLAREALINKLQVNVQLASATSAIVVQLTLLPD